MKLKSLMVRLALVGAILGLVFVSAMNTGDHDYQSENSVHVSSDTGLAESDVVTSIPDIREEARSQDIVSPVQAQPIETQVVIGRSLNSGLVVNPEAYSDVFPQLVDEFRLGGAEQLTVRQRYSEFFLRQPEILSGEVSLDLLECGLQICVAEVRSSDSQALDDFSKQVRQREGWDTRAALEFPSRFENVRRLAFSHDPQVNSVTLPKR